MRLHDSEIEISVVTITKTKINVIFCEVFTMEALLVILKNLENQFNANDLNSEETWSEEKHQKFWHDFEAISAVLKLEINKLALVLDGNKKGRSKKDVSEAAPIIDTIEKASTHLWVTFLTLSLQSGRTFCQEIAKIGQILMRSTHDLIKTLQNSKSRQESLQHVGEIWEKCDRLKSSVPRNNVLAVCQSMQAERNLVQDALQELEEAKNLQLNEDNVDENDDLIDDFEARWSEIELTVLAPAIGLLKAAQAMLKKVQIALKEKGRVEI